MGNADRCMRLAQGVGVARVQAGMADRSLCLPGVGGKGEEARYGRRREACKDLFSLLLCTKPEVSRKVSSSHPPD